MNRDSVACFSLSTVGALVICLSASTAHANSVTFDWAEVGNAGNAADSTGYGSVGYDYRISKYEVTNAQYATFLNAVDADGTNGRDLYSPNMAGDLGGIELQAGNASGSKYVAQVGREQNPVTYVSWYDAARFTNWLHNGQGAGGTESGVYDMSLLATDPASITRAMGASYFIPSENEWYKAAYHDASAGAAGDYFRYATGSDTAPGNDTASGANYHDGDFVSYTGPGSNPFTDVGAFTAAVSPYGTFDQNGNVFEWNEATITVSSRDGSTRVDRGLRGSGWGGSDFALQSSARFNLGPTIEYDSVGFRVASSAAVTAVPSPTAAFAGLAMLGGLALRRRR